jgi:hypothetical protein
VIGSAGSDDKVKLLVEEYGFDAAFNYKDGPAAQQLAQESAPSHLPWGRLNPVRPRLGDRTGLFGWFAILVASGPSGSCRLRHEST